MRRHSSNIGAAPSLPHTISDIMFQKATTARQDVSPSVLVVRDTDHTANSGWGVIADRAHSSSPSSMTKTNSSSEKSPIYPSSPPTNTIGQVECRTEDGQTKTVPMYKAGMRVCYKGQNDNKSHAQILNVHLDDGLEPYYTIQLEDGREK